MTIPSFGFGTAPTNAVEHQDVEQAPEPARPAPPERGAVVRWTETDPYDDLAPQKVRYGVVIEHTADGAALVLQLGEIRNAAHFGPGAPTSEQDPVVSNLTRVS
ncbi:hypothetical protein [Streptomyces laurentii]|uniref:hypothetical protein n=1 Tax=Streptomyces laurentii TaxID=39478 RepID=UPI0036B10A8C